MKLHKYRARTEAEAFRQVRAELGPDAIVLASRPARRPGLRGLLGGSQEVEVTAVVDPLAGDRREALPPPPASPRPPAASRARQEYAEIRTTLAEITTTLNRLSQAGATATLTTVDHLHTNLREIYHRLLAQDVEPRLAERLLAAVRNELSPGALDDRRIVASCLERHLLAVLPDPRPVSAPPGQPLALILIGPTGVGKTTTIAKLAARFAMLDHRRVALVTVDTFRIAAAEQLRVYANIIGLPLEIAYTTTDLVTAVHRHRDKDILLIDTPGRSPRHAGHLTTLQAFVEAVPHRRLFLTIDASTRYADMLDVATRFGFAPFDGLIITKIDETTQHGSLLNLVERTRCPLIYVTNGQEVPDDIEDITPHRVVELVLGGAA